MFMNPQTPNQTSSGVEQGLGAHDSPFALGRSRNRWARTAPEVYVTYPKVPLLGYLEQTKLIRDAQRGDIAARNKVWVHNLRLVLSVANRVHIPQSLVEDLLQEGSTGIEVAIRRFEIQRGLTLGTYAWHWIRQRMTRAAAVQRFRMNVPAQLYGEFCRHCREYSRLAGRREWFDWYSAERDKSPESRKHMTALHTLHLGGSIGKSALRVCDTRLSPSDRVGQAEIRLAVQQCALRLKPREQLVLMHRYGLNGEHEKTLEELGGLLNVTRERVRQIELKAESKIRFYLRKRLRGYLSIVYPWSTED